MIVEDFDNIFNEQLQKLDVEYLYFYLFHALNKEKFETVKKFNLIERAVELKKAGKIRHLGFSFHDSLEVFKEIIDYYDGWEFCQIQYNYINTNYQAGTEG